MRLAIFDFDGTLADTWAWFAAALADVSERFDLRRVGPEELERLRGRPNREIVRAFRVPWWKLPRIATYMRAHAAAAASRIALFPGAAELVRDLAAAGCTVAIVSSNREDTIRRVLGPELAAAVARYDCGASLYGKAAKFRKVVRRSGVPRADAIAIGDEVRDVDAARDAGIASGAVTWGYATEAALREAGPTHVFASIAALRAFCGLA